MLKGISPILSPDLLSVLCRITPREFLKVIPGIRAAGGITHDQARVGTPSAALRAGATHLVVGRAITGAEDPAGAARGILEEMSAAV